MNTWLKEGAWGVRVSGPDVFGLKVAGIFMRGWGHDGDNPSFLQNSNDPKHSKTPSLYSPIKTNYDTYPISLKYEK